jgi:hypothetical protein
MLILNSLWTWVGEKAGPAMTGPMCWEIRKRISRIRLRLTILAKRFHDGTLAPPKPRARRRAPPEPAEGAAPKPGPTFVFPRHFGWLCGLVPAWAAGCGSNIKHLMNQPEIRALEAASPEAKRLLASLLWMTGNTHPDFRGLPPGSRRGRSRAAPAGGEPGGSGRATAASAAAAAASPAVPAAPGASPPAAPAQTGPAPEPETWYPYRVGWRSPWDIDKPR